MANNKKIFYYTLGIHTYMENLLKNPPPGYEFIIVSDSNKKELINKLKSKSFIKFIYKTYVKRIFNVYGILNKIYSKKSPDESDLILSTGPIVNEEKPWVIKILDTPFSLAGNDYNLFIRNLDKIEKSLASPYCKKIIVHTNRCKEHMKKYFSNKVMDKIVILTPAIKKDADKFNKMNSNKINFLFMGSINNPDEFYMKGGIESIETFIKLRERFDNIELKIRCKVPDFIKEKKIEGLTIIENNLPWNELEELYRDTDILLMPAYGGYFIMAYLESFSYGIPIIALDTYGVNEFVINGETGFHVNPSLKAPIFSEEYPANTRTINFIEIIKEGDPEVIDNLVNKCSNLINNRRLLLKMSNNCKDEFKNKYSFEDKINNLKDIFDDALEND